MKPFVAILLFLLGGGAHAQEISTPRPEPEKDIVRLSAFLSQLQRAVASDDRSALVSMVQFPVQRGPAGELISQAQLLAVYQEIMNEHTKRVVASQTVEGLFRDERGVAIGSGEIWFKYLSGVDGFRITMFDVSKYAAVGVVSMEETEEVDGLFVRFQRALEKSDRRGVLRLLAFPIRVNHPPRSRIFRNGAELSQDFYQVFNAKVRKAVQTQRVPDLFVNSDGIMVGTGQLWFSPERLQGKLLLRVTTINN